MDGQMVRRTSDDEMQGEGGSWTTQHDARSEAAKPSGLPLSLRREEVLMRENPVADEGGAEGEGHCGWTQGSWGKE